jgi:hypothetical protein
VKQWEEGKHIIACRQYYPAAGATQGNSPPRKPLATNSRWEGYESNQIYRQRKKQHSLFEL